MEFNFFSRSIYSSLVFFVLVFRKVNPNRDQHFVRELVCFHFTALAINKLLKIKNNRLFYYFYRLILRERKLYFFTYPSFASVCPLTRGARLQGRTTTSL